mmetsp:Transcript_106843/g.300790  ORF Transcript_106843/g.300790 Transcript_106843/m.300790 type:complete len:283 (+) Transcript_106843:324-1172(+)
MHRVPVVAAGGPVGEGMPLVVHVVGCRTLERPGVDLAGLGGRRGPQLQRVLHEVPVVRRRAVKRSVRIADVLTVRYHRGLSFRVVPRVVRVVRGLAGEAPSLALVPRRARRLRRLCGLHRVLHEVRGVPRLALELDVLGDPLSRLRRRSDLHLVLDVVGILCRDRGCLPRCFVHGNDDDITVFQTRQVVLIRHLLPTMVVQALRAPEVPASGAPEVLYGARQRHRDALRLVPDEALPRVLGRCGRHGEVEGGGRRHRTSAGGTGTGWRGQCPSGRPTLGPVA